MDIPFLIFDVKYALNVNKRFDDLIKEGIEK
jgi:hypothetical protein